MKILLANFAKMLNDSGGLAKVTVAFANEMISRGHDVVLVFSDENEGKFFYKISDSVTIYNLSYRNGRKCVFPISMKIKREITRVFSTANAREVNDQFMIKNYVTYIKDILLKEKPDVIISSQPAASRLLLLNLDVKIPVITMSHGDPEDYFHTYPKQELAALEKSAACQVLLPSFVNAIKRRFPKQNVVEIGNVVPQYDIKAALDTEKKIYKILFIGRLVKNHKRQHLLIEAFGKIANQFPQWIVEIWGDDGNKKYKKQLIKLIKDHRLEKVVFLKGITHDVKAVLKTGDIFVIPSAYEGFGLSLAEAMSMGVPVIGYKSCSAVNELIEDKKNGILCNDGVNDLAMAMKTLMINKNMRVKFGNEARNKMKKYNSALIWKQWESLILSVVNKKHRVR